jgi:hypothetical protein
VQLQERFSCAEKVLAHEPTPVLADVSHVCSMDRAGRPRALRAMKTMRPWLALRQEGRGVALCAVARGWS